MIAIWFSNFLEQKLPLQAAGNFLLNGKKSPKNVSFSHIGRCPQTARPCCWLRTARIPARDHPRIRLSVTGIELLETLDGTKPRAVRFKSKNIFSCFYRPAARARRAVIVYKKLHTGHFPACSDGDRAQGCARSAASSTDVLSADSIHCEQSKTFFGDFLPLSKKLPAACGGSFCSKKTQTPTPQSS
jgi:hypothetical protein